MNAVEKEEAMEFASKAESAAHGRLKQLAIAWAQGHRLGLWGSEVRLPRSSYRADIAAATPSVVSAGAFTAVFECKAYRSDYLRDAAPESATAMEIAELTERLNSLRELIGAHRPDLRRGEELFAAFDCVDLRGLRHETHERITQQLRVAQNKLFNGTKFSKMQRWRSASLLYAVCEPEILQSWELPDGWGLLVRNGDALELKVKPLLNETTPQERIALLERIAASSATRVGRRLGLARPESRVSQV
ncbi:MAG TPA: hypothetical protein VKC60_15105 [Opitutaceae bacterium]|nr:hypothetical protein [Opitutaceae bacterium]